MLDVDIVEIVKMESIYRVIVCLQDLKVPLLILGILTLILCVGGDIP